MLPIEPFNLRSLYKITLILSSDYFQTSYEFSIFTRTHQNLKSFPVYDPENPVTYCFYYYLIVLFMNYHFILIPIHILYTVYMNQM